MVTVLVFALFLAGLAIWLATEWRVATAKPQLAERRDDGRTTWLLTDRRRGLVYEFEDRQEAERSLELLRTDPGRSLADD